MLGTGVNAEESGMPFWNLQADGRNRQTDKQIKRLVVKCTPWSRKDSGRTLLREDGQGRTVGK